MPYVMPMGLTMEVTMDALQQISGDAPEPTLSELVDDLIRPHRAQVTATACVRVAIGELDNRTRALEQAILEIARELEHRVPAQ
jgi:hypothetical protein